MAILNQHLTLNDNGPYSAAYVPVARARIFNATNGLRPTGWSFSRSKVGWSQNASGLLVQSAANAERLDYANGVPQGLMYEPASNGLTPDLTCPGYQANSGNSTITDVAGGQNAYVCTEDTTASNVNDGHAIYNANGGVAYNPNSFLVVSGFAKANTRTKVSLLCNYDDQSQGFYAQFDLSNGTFIQTGTFTSVVSSSVIGRAGIEKFANGWYRVWVCGFLATANIMLIAAIDSTGRIDYTGDGASNFYVMYPNVVAGTSLTSFYNPAVGRAADVGTFTLASDAVALIFTFDDGSKQTIAGLTPGATYTIPNTLNRNKIMYIDDSTGATAAAPPARRRPLMLLAS